MVCTMTSDSLNEVRLIRYLIGGPGYTLYHSFSGVLLAAGGSGISFVLAIAQELLQRAAIAPRSTNTRAIEIVWSVQHARQYFCLLINTSLILIPC